MQSETHNDRVGASIAESSLTVCEAMSYPGYRIGTITFMATYHSIENMPQASRILRAISLIFQSGLKWIIITTLPAHFANVLSSAGFQPISQ